MIGENGTINMGMASQTTLEHLIAALKNYYSCCPEQSAKRCRNAQLIARYTQLAVQLKGSTK